MAAVRIVAGSRSLRRPNVRRKKLVTLWSRDVVVVSDRGETITAECHYDPPGGWWGGGAKRGGVPRPLFNLIKPTCYVMHHLFNIQQLYALPTLYLCVLYLSENKQRLVSLTA